MLHRISCNVVFYKVITNDWWTQASDPTKWESYWKSGWEHLKLCILMALILRTIFSSLFML